MVHGLAGSAAVALLVLTAIQQPAYSAYYLLIFGAGTIVGMMLITAVIATPFIYSTGRSAGMSRNLRLTAGVASIGFGLFLAWQIGVVDGLFIGQPTWSPH
jgi:high-affinity nickel-transport protein